MTISDDEQEIQNLQNKIYDLEDTIASQSAEIARLREALEPFANEVAAFLPDDIDSKSIWGNPRIEITLGDLRRAARALEGEK